VPGLGFIGSYEHSLDAKSRIVLPAQFRKEFATEAFLTQHYEGCLALWTPDEFAQQVQGHRDRQGLSAKDRNETRLWAARAFQVQIDKLGRVAIPQKLKEFAHLDGTVVVTGALDRVELWDPERWGQRVEPSEDSLSNPTDGGAPAAD